MKSYRLLLTMGAVVVALGMVVALPAHAAGHRAPSPKSGKTVPSTGKTGTPSTPGTGSTIQKVPPHSNQGPLTLPPY